VIAAPWEIPGPDDDEQAGRRPIPRVVSLHFVRTALRRRWLVCVLSAVLGLLMAAAFLVAFPTSHQAKASLVLTHDPQVEPTRAMATDVSLLRTRTVAAKTIAKLGLAMAPEDFLKSVVAEPVSSELLTLTLSAPSDAEAVRRLSALTSTYLEFRGEQLSLQSNVLVSGLKERIKNVEAEVAAVSRRIDQLSTADSSSASKLSDTISQRAYLQSRIETLQQSVEDATLQTTALVSSSRVIDPAAVEKGGVKRRIALTLASGLIGGAALGCGTVLFFAITSDRLRRRSDISAALEVPVPVSVGRIAPVPRKLLWLPPMRALEGRRTDGRQRLARMIGLELPAPRQSGRLAVVCIGNAKEVRSAVAAAASELVAARRSVSLIDLTRDGTVDLQAQWSGSGAVEGLAVWRPIGIPALANGPADLRTIDQRDGGSPSLESTDVRLVLADLDPAIGVEYLTQWTSRVVIVVTAGRSSAEMVRTAADLVRAAGLESRVAGLLHVEPADHSSGTAGFDRSLTAHLEAQFDRAESTSGYVDEERVSAAEQQAHDDEQRQTGDGSMSEDADTIELVMEESNARRTTGGLQIYLAEYPLVHLGSAASSENGKSDRSGRVERNDPDSEHPTAVTVDQTGLITEPDEVPAWHEMGPNGWHLYADAYPLAHADSRPNGTDQPARDGRESNGHGSDQAADSGTVQQSRSRRKSRRHDSRRSSARVRRRR
jgi:capsular polysaccharide biosynthesis protein